MRPAQLEGATSDRTSLLIGPLVQMVKPGMETDHP